MTSGSLVHCTTDSLSGLTQAVETLNFRRCESHRGGSRRLVLNVDIDVPGRELGSDDGKTEP